MRVLPISLLAALATVGCHEASGSAGRSDRTVHVAATGGNGHDGMSVSIPGFDAKVALPGLDLGRHVDLDGIKVAPGTNVRALDVTGHDGGEGEDGVVRISFTSPQAPAALVDHYRRSAAAAGYRAIDAAPAALTATKDGKRFALMVVAERGGSRGTITVTGRN